MHTATSRSVWISLLSIGVILVGRATSSASVNAQLEAGQIVVRVLGPDGQPRPDAALRLYKFNVDWRSWVPTEAPAQAAPDDAIRIENLEGTSHLLVARADGGLLGIKDVLLLDGEPGQRAEVTLGKTASTVLHVRDAGGRPVSGARVYLLNYTGTGGSALLTGYSFDDLGLDGRSSDTQGRLQLPALPDGGRADVTLVHADYAPVKIEDVTIADGATADAVLEPGVEVTYRVLPSPPRPTEA